MKFGKTNYPKSDAYCWLQPPKMGVNIGAEIAEPAELAVQLEQLVLDELLASIDVGVKVVLEQKFQMRNIAVQLAAIGCRYKANDP